MGARKLIGSAQRRQRGAFLQHGSVVLDADPARIRAVFPGEVDPTGGMTTLADALGAPPARAAVVAALTVGLGVALGVALEPSGLSPDETALADALGRAKYRYRRLDGERPAAGRRGRTPGGCGPLRRSQWTGSAGPGRPRKEAR